MLLWFWFCFLFGCLENCGIVWKFKIFVKFVAVVSFLSVHFCCMLIGSWIFFYYFVLCFGGGKIMVQHENWKFCVVCLNITLIKLIVLIRGIFWQNKRLLLISKDPSTLLCILTTSRKMKLSVSKLKTSRKMKLSISKLKTSQKMKLSVSKLKTSCKMKPSVSKLKTS